jgi:hypothetical protein
MVIVFIAGVWTLLMLLVLALCRASARADTAVDLLQGDHRRQRDARLYRAASADRARRASLTAR